MQSRRVFDWRIFVVVGGGITALVNHDACQQYEQKLDPLKSTVDVSSQAGSHALMVSTRASKQKTYGYFEGTVHASAPLATPPSPTHGHRSFDMTLLQQYSTTAAVAKHIFSPAASIKDRVWVINPPTKRNRDSGLQAGGGLTAHNSETGVTVQIDPSFLPKMRLKQLFYYDTISTQDKYLHNLDTRTDHHTGSESAGGGGEEEQRRVNVVGGLPEGHSVCLIGDFICEHLESDSATHAHDDPASSSTISIVSAAPSNSSNGADQRLSGSFFGSFEEVSRAKKTLHEGHKTCRLAGGAAAAGALVLLIIFPV